MLSLRLIYFFATVTTDKFLISDSILIYLSGYSSKYLFVRGNSGFLYRKSQSDRVVKYLSSDAFADLNNKLNIYTRLTEGGGCNKITQYHGKVKRDIELEYLNKDYLTSILKDLKYSDEDLKQQFR